MATVREVKRRIRSVENVSKITRAMEAVASFKMKRAQDQALASKPYAEKAWELLLHLAGQTRGDPVHPLCRERPVETIGLILITADRGLCGTLNQNIIHEAMDFIKAQEHRLELITVGRKGRDAMLRRGRKIRADFSLVHDPPRLEEATPIARVAIEDFLNGIFDEVHLAYTQFINMFTRRPIIVKLLPIRPHAEDHHEWGEYIYEPSEKAILEEVVPRFTELKVYQAVLEASASEHSARMIAMREATENATEMTEELNLEFFRARQQAITREIMDIIGGVEALGKLQSHL